MTYRLPKHIRPLEYKLHLHPDLGTGKFAGEVEIQLNISDWAQQIFLHSNLLLIGETKFNAPDGKQIQVDFSRALLRSARQIEVSSALVGDSQLRGEVPARKR